MKILLDENFPKRLRFDFSEHVCEHVILIGWEGTHNGALLKRAEEEGFDILVTLDANIPYQNELAGRHLSVIVVRPDGQGVQAVQRLMNQVLEAVGEIGEGEVRVVSNRPRGQ